jgi:asparagine N-glycosylation enzyme membrane subunit Stt3
MNDFGVLTNRKRAVIALIHTIVFLGIALHGFVSPKAGILHRSGTAGDFILIAIYLIVAAILVWLVTISRSLAERAYFALCATSATSGLLRTIFGDLAVPPAQYARVLMLGSAVGIGIIIIIRSHSRAAIGTETPPLPSEASPD